MESCKESGFDGGGKLSLRHCEKHTFRKASGDPRRKAHMCIRMLVEEKALDYHTAGNRCG